MSHACYWKAVSLLRDFFINWECEDVVTPAKFREASADSTPQNSGENGRSNGHSLSPASFLNKVFKMAKGDSNLVGKLFEVLFTMGLEGYLYFKMAAREEEEESDAEEEEESDVFGGHPVPFRYPTEVKEGYPTEVKEEYRALLRGKFEEENVAVVHTDSPDRSKRETAIRKFARAVSLRRCYRIAYGRGRGYVTKEEYKDAMKAANKLAEKLMADGGLSLIKDNGVDVWAFLYPSNTLAVHLFLWQLKAGLSGNKNGVTEPVLCVVLCPLCLLRCPPSPLHLLHLLHLLTLTPFPLNAPRAAITFTHAPCKSSRYSKRKATCCMKILTSSCVSPTRPRGTTGSRKQRLQATTCSSFTRPSACAAAKRPVRKRPVR